MSLLLTRPRRQPVFCAPSGASAVGLEHHELADDVDLFLKISNGSIGLALFFVLRTRVKNLPCLLKKLLETISHDSPKFLIF